MMSVSFEVTLSQNNRIARFLSRPCFASVNSAITYQEKRDDTCSIQSVKYLPFFHKYWCEERDRSVEDYRIHHNLEWDLCYDYWEYLMTLKFITDALVRVPTTREEMKRGFEVKADLPADRVMVTLFILRAPQFLTSIVRDWHSMVNELNINPDTAFVCAFALNNYMLNGSESPTYKMGLESSSESTIIYPEYFSLRGARIMLNRLLCDDYDKKLFGGEQDTLRHKHGYDRQPKEKKSALGRFFCKKPSRRKGNLQTLIYNMVEDIPVDSHSQAVREKCNSFRNRAVYLDIPSLFKLVKLIEA